MAETCATCGAERGVDARFCPACGQPAAELCRACGAELPADARFCPACGAPTVAAPVPVGEHKVVTILFADLIGSTRVAERLDTERLGDVMGEFFAAMREEIEAQGGTVEKFIGDAVMAVFGVPTAHEDDPARALRAAEGMRRRLDQLNRGAPAADGVTLALRIGVNTGPVLVRADARPDTGMVTGDAVNVAARLEQSADAGQVLVAERTARACRGFRFTPLGPMALRGKEAAVPAYALVGVPDAGEARGVPGLHAPMVGRDPELALLGALYARVVAERRPHLATIFGEPGVGKSRLTREFIAAAETADPAPRVLRGRCLPYGDGVTWWPLAEILKGLAGVRDSDPPALTRERIAALGREVLGPRLGEGAAEAAEALAYTVGLDAGASGLAARTPLEAHAAMRTAWRALFSALAAEDPLIVVVEDIHWADPALLDLLEELAARTEGPALYLCPSRPELTGRRPDWGGGRLSATSVLLEPLSAADADRLVGLLLEIDELPEVVRGRILGRAEGNPFFLEEIVHELIDAGRLEHADGRWRAAPGIEAVEIPDSVQAVLAARMDLLDPSDKRVLQLAAVVGRVFWTGSLRALSARNGDALEAALERLRERELVVERVGSALAGQRELLFKHILTRDVAYASLPRRERADAHAGVARWIEETATGRREELAELVAHHWIEAHRGVAEDPRVDPAQREELRGRAYAAAMEAAADAQRRRALEKSRRLAREARALAADADEAAAALERLGQASFHDFRGDDAWRAYCDGADVLVRAGGSERAGAIARFAARAVEVPARWSGTLSRSIPEEEAKRYLDLGLAHAHADDAARALLLAGRGFWAHGYPKSPLLSPEGREEAAAGEEGANLALRIGRVELALAALDAVQAVHMHYGRLRAAGQTLDRRLRLVGELSDPQEVADTYAMAAAYYTDVGRYEQAEEAGTRGIALTLELYRAGAIHCLSWSEVARFHLGRWDDFLASLGWREELLEGRLPVHGASRSWACAVLVHEARGDRAAADRYLADVDLIEGGRPRANCTPEVARALARMGRPEEAHARIDQALAVAHPDSRARLLPARCDVLAEEGAWDTAAKAAAAVRSTVLEDAQTILPYADRLEGRAALATGSPAAAAARLAAAALGFAALRAGWELACTRLWLAEAHAAAGRPDLALAALAAARPALEAVGSRRESGHAAELATRLASSAVDAERVRRLAARPA
jgi:class 3 adenylate cyclase